MRSTFVELSLFSQQIFFVWSAMLKHCTVPALGAKNVISGISLTAAFKQNGG